MKLIGKTVDSYCYCEWDGWKCICFENCFWRALTIIQNPTPFARLANVWVIVTLDIKLARVFFSQSIFVYVELFVYFKDFSPSICFFFRFFFLAPKRAFIILNEKEQGWSFGPQLQARVCNCLYLFMWTKYEIITCVSWNRCTFIHLFIF